MANKIKFKFFHIRYYNFIKYLRTCILNKNNYKEIFEIFRRFLIFNLLFDIKNKKIVFKLLLSLSYYISIKNKYYNTIKLTSLKKLYKKINNLLESKLNFL